MCSQRERYRTTEKSNSCQYRWFDSTMRSFLRGPPSRILTYSFAPGTKLKLILSWYTLEWRWIGITWKTYQFRLWLWAQPEPHCRYKVRLSSKATTLRFASALSSKLVLFHVGSVESVWIAWKSLSLFTTTQILQRRSEGIWGRPGSESTSCVVAVCEKNAEKTLDQNAPLFLNINEHCFILFYLDEVRSTWLTNLHILYITVSVCSASCPPCSNSIICSSRMVLSVFLPWSGSAAKTAHRVTSTCYSLPSRK